MMEGMGHRHYRNHNKGRNNGKKQKNARNRSSNLNSTSQSLDQSSFLMPNSGEDSFSMLHDQSVSNVVSKDPVTTTRKTVITAQTVKDVLQELSKNNISIRNRTMYLQNLNELVEGVDSYLKRYMLRQDLYSLGLASVLKQSVVANTKNDPDLKREINKFISLEDRENLTMVSSTDDRSPIDVFLGAFVKAKEHKSTEKLVDFLVLFAELPDLHVSLFDDLTAVLKENRHAKIKSADILEESRPARAPLRVSSATLEIQTGSISPPPSDPENARDKDCAPSTASISELKESVEECTNGENKENIQQTPKKKKDDLQLKVNAPMPKITRRPRSVSRQRVARKTILIANESAVPSVSSTHSIPSPSNKKAIELERPCDFSGTDVIEVTEKTNHLIEARREPPAAPPIPEYLAPTKNLNVNTGKSPVPPPPAPPIPVELQPRPKEYAPVSTNAPVPPPLPPSISAATKSTASLPEIAPLCANAPPPPPLHVNTAKITPILSAAPSPSPLPQNNEKIAPMSNSVPPPPPLPGTLNKTPPLPPNCLPAKGVPPPPLPPPLPSNLIRNSGGIPAPPPPPPGFLGGKGGIPTAPFLPGTSSSTVPPSPTVKGSEIYPKTKKTMTLLWEPISHNAIQNSRTVFNAFNKPDFTNEEREDLQQVFERIMGPPRPSLGEKKKKEVVTPMSFGLSSQRSLNLEIALAKLRPLTVPDLLNRMDKNEVEGLSVDVISGLLKHFPTDDELSCYETVDRSLVVKKSADLLCWEIRNRMETKLKFKLFILKSSIVADISQHSSIVSHLSTACETVLGEDIALIINKSVQYGNYLNQGTSMHGSAGFSLTSFKTTLSTRGKSSGDIRLVDLLVKHADIDKKSVESVDAKLTAVKSVSVQEVENQIKMLSTQIQDLTSEVNKSKDDALKIFYIPLLKEYASDAVKLSQDLANIRRLEADIQQFFCTPKMSLEEIIGTLAEGISLYSQAFKAYLISRNSVRLRTPRATAGRDPLQRHSLQTLPSVEQMRKMFMEAFNSTSDA